MLPPIKLEVENADHLTRLQKQAFIAGVKNDLTTQYIVNPEMRTFIDKHVEDNEPLVVQYISSHSTKIAADVALAKVTGNDRKNGAKLIKRVNPKKRRPYK